MTTWGELLSNATVTTGGASTWEEVTGKPETFPPSTHAHAAGDVTGTAVLTNDTRLSDARTPTTHSHAAGDVTGTAVLTNDARLSDARTPTTHTHAAGDITGTAVVTNDARLSDARTPTSHGNAQHTSTFLTASGTPDGTKFLRDDLTWQAVTGGSGLTHPQVLARSLGA